MDKKQATRISTIAKQLQTQIVGGEQQDIAVIVDGCRTPFAKSFGTLMYETSIDLGVVAVKGLIDKTKLDVTQIDEVVFGNVVVTSGSPNIAREIVLDAGLPSNIPASTTVLQCLSGLDCVAQAARLIEHGDAECVVAGGSDSLSSAEVPLPSKLTLALGKYAMGGGSKNGMSGVWEMLQNAGSPTGWVPGMPAIAERSTGQTMGWHADMMGEINKVDRVSQEKWAIASHSKAAAAINAGYIPAEIAPVRTRGGTTTVDADDLVRPGMTEESVRRLKPVFRDTEDGDGAGTVTAASSSALTDGASAVLVMGARKAAALGYPTDVVVRAYAKTAIDPHPQLLLAPALAIPKALDRAKLTLDDIDIFEIHEAFAAQVLATIACLDSDEFAKEYLGRDTKVGSIPHEKINPNGSSIAIGHPFAATGGRIVTSLVATLRRTKKRYGLISVCAAGGIGGVMILENTRHL